jgi:hypothetical protein
MGEQDLVAGIEMLEAVVLELRRQIEQDKPRFGSMRDTQRCPACGGGALIHFRRIEEATQPYGNNHIEFGLGRRISWNNTKARAPLEAFACRACGLVEWHALNVDDVTADETIVFIEPAPGSGPFR